MRYKTPPLPPAHLSRPEKLGGGVLDLWVGGARLDATRLADREVVGPAGRRWLADMTGIPPALDDGAGRSKNIPVMKACAGYVALREQRCRDWLIAYADRRHPLWRSETLSHVYSFILPALLAALATAVERQDDELTTALVDLLLRHAALLDALRWPWTTAKRSTGYRNPPLGPAKRTPWYRYGPRLADFLESLYRPLSRAKRERALASDATGWPDRLLVALEPHAVLNSTIAARRELEKWPRRLREEVTLEETLEVVVRGGDTSRRFLGPTTGGSTAPTAAVSDVGGTVHLGGVHRHDDRGGLGRTETAHVGGWISITARGVDPSPKPLPPGVSVERDGDRETLYRKIPAPFAVGAEVWHLGPGGWKAGSAP